MGWHVTEEGEHVTSIAAESGFPDYQEIWNHPSNAALKALRVNPNVLMPGDRLFIPDIEPAQFARPTDVEHKFKLTAHTLQLRVRLLRAYAKPIASNSCPLRVDRDSYPETTTNGQGLVEHDINKTAAQGTLTIKNFIQGIRGETPADKRIKLRIGWLDPVDSVSGQQARLMNLGYYRGTLDRSDSEELRSAVEEFQCDNSLGVDGKCGPITQGKLKLVHGC